MGNVALNRRCTIICQNRKKFNQTAFPHILQHQKQQIMFEGYKMYNVLLRLCTFHSNAWVWYGSFVCFVEFTHFSQPKEIKIVFSYYQMCMDVVWQNILFLQQHCTKKHIDSWNTSKSIIFKQIIMWRYENTGYSLNREYMII